MAGYNGGGGGGASVVPASFVVGSDRADYDLTQAGLVAAIADLPASGGSIYIGAGTLALASTVTIDRDIKLYGSGIGCTIIDPASGVTCFNLGAFSLTIEDIEFVGDASASSKLLNITASSDSLIIMNRVQVGTSALTGLEVIIDANTFSRNYKISNSKFYVDGAGTAWFYQAGGSGDMELSNVTALQEAAMASGPSIKASNTRITGGVATTFALGSEFSTCFLNAETLTFGNQCLLSACLISNDTAMVFGSSCTVSSCQIDPLVSFSVGGSCTFTACRISGVTMTATGDGVQVIGCQLVSFTSATAGVDNHVLKGNTFSGAGNNVTLTDCDGCIVEGNISCQVNETGSSDGNRYDNNQGFLGSTIIGPTSVVNGGGPVLFFPFAGVVDTGSNALLQHLSLPNAAMIRRLRATIKTPPTGQALIVSFKKVTLSTGVVGASIGTVSIAAGAFEGTANVLSPAVSLAITEGLAMEVTQVGSGTPGSNLSGFADCFA